MCRWSAPIIIAVGVYELYKQVGWAAIIGLIVMIVFLPIAGMMTKAQIGYQKNAAMKTDRRVASVNEFIQGIRVLKFFGWEPKILSRLDAAREEELSWLKKYVILKSITFGTLMLVPLAVSITVFGTYVGTGGVMTPTVVFTAIALINVSVPHTSRTHTSHPPSDADVCSYRRCCVCGVSGHSNAVHISPYRADEPHAKPRRFLAH